ncbi:MAG: carbohydrate kinase family protein, partial [Anaerolineae bacterium]|nr:carbohydrate kinase family protein [Anaerolineae bacterium]
MPQISAETAASEGYLRPGRLSEVGAALISTGGAVANVGLALHKLGLDVRLVGRLGDDLIGHLTREILRSHAEKLVTELVNAPGQPGSYTLVFDPPGIDRYFLHCPGTNDTFGPEDLSDDLLSRARLLHFGYPPVMRRMYADEGEALVTILARAKALGVTTSLDLCMPDPNTSGGRADWRRILSRALPNVDLFGPSLEELLYMLRQERYLSLAQDADQGAIVDAIRPAEIGDLAQEALDLGASVVALKLGHRGLYLRSGGQVADMGRASPAEPDAWAWRELLAPCFQVQVEGTVGAGDTTLAGLLAALLKGKSPEEA